MIEREKARNRTKCREIFSYISRYFAQDLAPFRVPVIPNP